MALFTRNLQGFEGRECILTLELDRKQRTNPQNRYYWGVVIELIATEIGYRLDEREKLHELLKAKFLKGFEEINGKEFEIVGSTKKLDTKKFEEYMAQVRMWASEFLGLSIPEPNEINY